jgi:hypothetical protein
MSDTTTTIAAQTEITPENTQATATPEAQAAEMVETSPVAQVPEVTTANNTTEVDPILAERQKFLEKFSAYYLEHGTIEPVVKAYSTDYDKLSPEDLLRLDLKERYPDLSNDRFEKLYRKQVVEKYNLDSDLYDEDDVELGRELATRDSESIRKRLKDKASEWFAPAIGQEHLVKQHQQEVENWQKLVNEHPSNRRILESKTVAIKVGDTEFNAAVDPAQLLEITSDYTGQKFFQKFAVTDEKGNVSIDFDKWNRVVAYLLNEEGVVKGLFDLGKSTEGRQIIDGEIKNLQIDDKGVPATSPAAEDAKTRLLKAFLTKG